MCVCERERERDRDRDRESRRQASDLRFSVWLIRYFLKTFVYTPSTPCRDVKFSPNIPLGDLSWKSLTEFMWHRHIIGFFLIQKFEKNWPEKVHVRVEKDWSGSFVFLYVWNNEDVRWDFFYSNPLGSYEQSKFFRLVAKLKFVHNFSMDLNRKNPIVHLRYFIHRVR